MKGKPVGHQFDSCLSDLQRDTVQEPTLKSFENKLGNKKKGKNGLQTPIWIQANGHFSFQEKSFSSGDIA